ncbi:SHC-transforming protein 1 [Armadillidium nasatum]|uniref:SHC-transforming protein 1 n=1 Tax=Armadillidium nasatum TaxID=96803 RepID=A0A5N5T447_9CRUS|nr:SHC-transforming protein 1 [Armadillidium nasatum]
MEGGQGGSFINKPPRGWLHPDQQLAEEGICYGVRYIGALEVNTSMKSLNFDTRSLIAKECISKVCEAAGLKTADRKRKVVKSIGRIIGERPLMDHAGSNVTLTITSSALTLTTLEAGQVVASHDMPNISFASGGDPDTLDFIAYVARDNRYGRACFVLECGGGLAQDVITTIGQAFELRFKEYLKRAPSSVHYTNVKSSESGGANLNGDSNGGSASTTWNNKYDREYYNDLPGKVPPDLPPPPVPPFPQYSSSSTTNKVPSNVSPPSGIVSPVTTNVSNIGPVAATEVIGSLSSTSSSLHSTQQAQSNASTLIHTTQPKGNDNLIDLSSDGVSPTFTSGSQTVVNTTPRIEPEYVNESVIKQNQLLNEQQRDPFDMLQKIIE